MKANWLKCDFFSNQFTTGIVVSSTFKTEYMEVDGIEYPRYPYIREELIGTDTSNLFIDTLRFSNTYLSGIGGDYDGVIELSISGNRCVL